MLTFSIAAVRAVIARGRADAQAHGGFRDLYFGLRPGKGAQPGFWLVGDHGIYIMSNGKLPEGKKPMIVYAEECDPRTNEAWFEVKHDTYGGDDGADFIDAADVEAMMAASPEAIHLRFTFTSDSIQIDLIERRR